MKHLTTIVCLICLLALGGCNTMAGLGQDISNAGEAIKDAAK